MDEEVLISLVESYKELYDLQDPRYDDNMRRNNIWDEIGVVVQKTGKECRERWKRIRDNFMRARRLRKTKSGQGAKALKGIKYEGNLSFLMQYLKDETETTSNFPSTDSPYIDLSNLMDQSSPACNVGSNSPVEPSLGDTRNSSRPASNQSPQDSEGSNQSRPSYYIRKKPQTVTSDDTSSMQSLFKEYIEKKYSLSQQANTIAGFFTNQGEVVSKFPEHLQLKVKREVFRIVSEAEEELCSAKRRCETPRNDFVCDASPSVQQLTEHGALRSDPGGTNNRETLNEFLHFHN